MREQPMLWDIASEWHWAHVEELILRGHWKSDFSHSQDPTRPFAQTESGPKGPLLDYDVMSSGSWFLSPNTPSGEDESLSDMARPAPKSACPIGAGCRPRQWSNGAGRTRIGARPDRGGKWLSKNLGRLWCCRRNHLRHQGPRRRLRLRLGRRDPRLRHRRSRRHRAVQTQTARR